MAPKTLAALALIAPFAASAQPQQQTAPLATAPAGPLPHGTPIALDAAEKAMAAAEEEATRTTGRSPSPSWTTGGRPVALHRLDSTRIASIRIAEGKARSALEFRRSARALEDAVAGGGAGLRLFALDWATPLEGGVPIQAGGRIVGAIGVSGAQVARTGAEAAERRRKAGGVPGRRPSGRQGFASLLAGWNAPSWPMTVRKTLSEPWLSPAP